MTEGEALSRDAFLGGKVVLDQPKQGVRSGSDAVFLAAATAARAGDSVLDVGCGAGAAGLCLKARVPDVNLHGLEFQAEYADLARRNGVNTVWHGDLFAPPPKLFEEPFDWIMTNPPFYRANNSTSPKTDRTIARRAERPLSDWITACLRRLKPKGGFAMVHQIDALPEAMHALHSMVGDIAVLPLQARAGRPAKRMVLTARKGARGPFRLAPPLVLHDGAHHGADREDYSEVATAILRDGAALTF